jgi:N-acetylmuramoyl-L-alanine amidase
MSTRTGLPALLTCVVLAAAGCQEPQQKVHSVAFEEHVTTIDDLAARLGLRVTERDEAFVILKNAANTVLIFTSTDGRYFINGKPAGSVGTVKKVGSTVYVPETLISAIRPYLRIGGPEQPPVTVRPRPKTGTAVVIVDAGHGGKDPGTLIGGATEKYIDLQVAAKVAALLQQRGVTVVMTRERDQFIELEERAEVANRRNTDLFVSIHSDSAPDHGISGFTVYVAREASRESRRAAQSIATAMARTGSDSRGIREADYKVLVLTTCPAVLIEVGYLSNPLDARRLQDNAFQIRLAQAIVEGILSYLQ